MKWKGSNSLNKANRIMVYVFFMTFAVVCLYMLDTRWTKQLDSTYVVIANRQILPHEEIQEADVSLVRLKKDYAITGAIQDPYEVVGQEALQLIEAGDQLTLNRVDKMALLGTPGSTVVEVPQEWLLSVPGSLRRLDQVTIYAVPAKDASKVDPETGNGVALPASAKKVLEDIVVAYYKDSGSKEVQNAQENGNPNVRSMATVRGQKLELELTEDQLAQLSSLISANYQLIVGYRT
ncbi:SAF domain-containing protein [Paenibacillus cellulosilyticus]|uniref:SAF domain-containing protein n=1 Tax=Paenibacillus cellulosilyticus TaxID=375489 RepID=A0A2V2YSP1_9BACL|nr:SAF domain-containing protein [Paenibacillus cellulosilyticus]PWW01217.1 SAF domain-containing protein [Paenibacillus cellulosilyticus]QKS46828.1 hypothetical protein HUB94_20305 [Paenibacillus cellulosilyticus]